jgi:hypothetical protein
LARQDRNRKLGKTKLNIVIRTSKTKRIAKTKFVNIRKIIIVIIIITIIIITITIIIIVIIRIIKIRNKYKA